MRLRGDYLIRYNVADSLGYKAVELVRIVRVNNGSFAEQTAREIGTTSAHMGYYEHLPVNYSTIRPRRSVDHLSARMVQRALS